MQLSPPESLPPPPAAGEAPDIGAGAAALDSLQLESLALNLDAALRVHRRTQFFGWTQGLLQGLVRHEVLICALRGPEARALRVDSFSTAVADPARISEMFLHDASFAPHLVSAWEQRRFRPLVCELGEGPLAGGPLGRELGHLGASRLIVHGTHDASGHTASLFIFACRPREARSETYLVQLAVPFLHAAWLRTQVSGTAEEGAGTAPAPATTLTPREQQIMKWICLGKSNSEIGTILAISPLTVKNHVQKILRRLNVANRAQAVAKALELRVLGP